MGAVSSRVMPVIPLVPAWVSAGGICGLPPPCAPRCPVGCFEAVSRPAHDAS